MSLLRAERIKLFSTRTPWICTGLAIVASLAFTIALVGLNGEQADVTVGDTQGAGSLGRTVMLVFAVLAATSEFNWGTMRTTFQAVPKRAPALLAKVTVVGVWCGLVGLVVGFGSWGVGVLVKPEANLTLATAADWRSVAGEGVVFLLTGVLGVGVGMLLRSTAAALAVTLVWTQLVEGLTVLIPGIGHHLYVWMPMFAGQQFVGGSLVTNALSLGTLPLGPVGYVLYFAAICFVLFGAGLLLTQRRDA
jgi:ABC-2 type transport system permease protein